MKVVEAPDALIDTIIIASLLKIACFLCAISDRCRTYAE